MKIKIKRFTLMELLVVMVIIVIALLIALPILLKIIETATLKANKNSAYGIMATAKLYRMEKMYNNESIEENVNIFPRLIHKGITPEFGDVRVKNDGSIAIALKYGDKCYRKFYNEEDIIMLKYTKKTCDL